MPDRPVRTGTRPASTSTDLAKVPRVEKLRLVPVLKFWMCSVSWNSFPPIDVKEP
ncbi:MAG: hypothetical protein ACKODA_12560 [Nevskiaceae bacterium]